MCERFAQVWDEDLAWYVRRWTGAGRGAVDQAVHRAPGKDYNVAPEDPVGVVVEADGRPTLQWMRWGFPLRQLVINTRLEAVLDSPTWRPLMDHRAAVPMTGFYEWAAADGQPHFFHRRDGEPMMVAAVHGVRRTRDEVRPCMSLLTGPASPDVAEVRGRIPWVLEPDHVAAWLDPGVGADDAVALIGTPQTGTLAHYPVAREVMRSEATGAELLAPVAVARGR